MSNVEYLSCAKTAQLVRTALKAKFPEQKFSVRSHVYSGGASIRVGWVDGPEAAEVEAVTKAFEGGRFDGMIDLAYHVEHWMMLDGTVMVASNPGSAGSGGVHSREASAKPHPDARRVSFGADYIFCNRERSASAKAA